MPPYILPPARLLYFVTALVATSIVATVGFAGAGQPEAQCKGNSPKKSCPTVTPADGATVSGTVLVTAQVTEPVASIAFEVDDAQLAPKDTAAPYETPWDTTKWTNGTHVLRVTSSDSTDPTVGLTSPSAGATVSGSVSVAATASDNVAVVGVQFKVDGANIGPADTTAPYSTLWSSINVPNGTHTLTAVARDMRLNASPSQAVVVNVNNQAGQPVNSLPPKKTPQNPGGGGGTPGAGGGGSGNPASPNPAPVLSRLKLSQATFRKGKPTTISFRLSEAAKVALSFERKLDGRRVRGRCVKPATGLRPNCTRYSRLKTGLTVRGKAGTNTVVFRGRLSRSKVLAVGRYRLTLVATDSTGKKSSARQVGFRMLNSVSVAQARAVRAVVLGWL